jgi:UDP-N-acetylglucosamine 2-epimerase (hydrolysing)
MKYNLCFVSGTRADYGKLKSLVKAVQSSPHKSTIFVTGMHMHKDYGYTINEIINDGFNTFQFINDSRSSSDMDIALANTVNGLSNYIRENETDIIVVHGDRLEALAGAIVGAFNNIPIFHIEGGEKSGTIDESIRHAVSKLSNIHLVSTDNAKKNLIRMGEKSDFVFNIGSPDIDVMFSKNLPTLVEVRERYKIAFEEYSIFMFHPITTEKESQYLKAQMILRCLANRQVNVVIIHPNNDKGSESIKRAIKEFDTNINMVSFPSLRFEYFLTLLKNAKFIIGNSSAGIREAYYYNVPSINIGDRQDGRERNNLVFDVDFIEDNISKTIRKVLDLKMVTTSHFDHGNGNSHARFMEVLNSTDWTKFKTQKKLNKDYD